MKVFSGFPAGKTHLTPMPDVFFTDLLPAIDDLGELKVTLHVIWLLDQKRGAMRFVSEGELLNDPVLLRGFAPAEPRAAQQLIRESVRRAVERGTLLPAQQADVSETKIYFLNSEKGRQSWEQAQRGEQPLRATQEASAPLQREGNNIFVLYEQNIGLLQPIIAEELKEAEAAYPPEWIHEAFRVAAANNVRSWRYIQRILERWAAEGRGEGREDEDDRKRYIEGKYADLYKRRAGE